MSHTPGPWRAENSSVIDPRNQIVTLSVIGCLYGKGRAEDYANARLIAAAPDLLDAHEPDQMGPDFLDWVADRFVNLHGEKEGTDYIIALRRRAKKARESIAKATGIAP